MSLARLALAYLASRPLLTALHVVLLSLGTATIVVLLLFTAQAERRLERDAKGVDLVVGAKGSPLQLILSSVLHVDMPTGNIPFAAARSLAMDPMVLAVIPLSLGDTYRGFRIVGTNTAFLELYEARVERGVVFKDEMEAVLGSTVAQRTGLGPGATFAGSHGLAASGAAHGEHPYRVVGVLAPTGTVADRLVLTPLESVWEVHGAHGTVAPGSLEITALLVRYRTPIAAAILPRKINSTTSMQAASPAYETARLMSLVGVGVDALSAFAAVLMVSAALSIFIALTSALQERRRDLALLRTLGASPGELFVLIAAEGMTLVGTGVILGLALGHGAADVMGRWLARSQAWSITGLTWERTEGLLVLFVLVVGAVTCLIPAIQAYRRDPATVLLEQ